LKNTVLKRIDDDFNLKEKLNLKNYNIDSFEIRYMCDETHNVDEEFPSFDDNTILCLSMLKKKNLVIKQYNDYTITYIY